MRKRQFVRQIKKLLKHQIKLSSKVNYYDLEQLSIIFESLKIDLGVANSDSYDFLYCYNEAVDDLHCKLISVSEEKTIGGSTIIAGLEYILKQLK